MSDPLLSVVVCNYNHGRYLRQCFTGLLNQTYRNFEILFTDDGSTDESQAIIRELAANDPRIKPEYNSQNRGVEAVYPATTARATGKYLYGCATDDFVINKDFFKRAVAILEGDSRAAGYYGITGVYVAETEKLSCAMGTAEVEGYNTPLQCCVGLLKYRSVVTSPSLVLRRELYRKHCGTEMLESMRTLKSLVDHSFNHELAWRYGMFYEKIPMACQRVYEAKTNYSSKMTIYELVSRLAEMERRLREIDITYPEMQKDWERWRAVTIIDFIKKSGVPI
jgi:glycosyltransferase involved in cell wall biosynthesis